MSVRTGRIASVRMLVVVLVGTLAVSLGIGSAGADNGLPSAGGTLWVTNQSTNTVAVYDAGTGAVLGLIPVGVKPIGVVAPHGTGEMYTPDEGSDTVSVIDKGCLCVVTTIPVGSKPHHMSQSANGNYVYAAEFGTNKVAVVNTRADTLVVEYVAGPAAARTHAVWASTDGKTLLVTNTVVNTIAGLDARSGEILWTVPVDDNPSEVLGASDGKLAYVTVRGEDAVKVVDTVTGTIVGQIAVGDQPDTMQPTPNGKTLVVALRGNPGIITLVDTGTLEATQIATPYVTTGHNAISANGRYSFFAAKEPGGVAVVEHDSSTLVATYPFPGGGRPPRIFHEPSRPMGAGS